MRPQIVYLSSAGAVPLAPEEAAPRAPLAVIADFVDESIERVALPRVRGLDEARLLARQLAQRFADTRYRLALRLPVRTAADTHLLVGVPAAGLDALLQPAVAAGREVLGVWTVGLLVAWWARRAGLRPARQLVIVPTPAGVRHVFLAGGLPVVSRLIPRDLSGQGSEAAPYEELERTVQYLFNARLAERDGALAAWGFGVDPGEFGAAARAPVRWEPVPVVRGLPDVGSRGLVALAELLAQRAPRSQLAPAELRVHLHARWVKRLATAAAGIGAGVLMASAASAWVDASLHAQAAAAIEAQAAATRRTDDAVQAAAAALGTTAEAAAQAIDVYERQVERAPQPAAAFTTLARAFDAVPAYALRELRWQAAQPDGAAADGNATAATRLAAQGAVGTTTAAAPDAAAECTPPEGLAAEVRVHLAGEIAAAASLRQAVAARQRFEALLAAAAAGVQVMQAPIEPAGPLAATQGPRPFAYCVYFRAAQ